MKYILHLFRLLSLSTAPQPFTTSTAMPYALLPMHLAAS